jgi:hypothetical protein
MNGDTDADLAPVEVAPVPSPEPPIKRRLSPADKWNAMDILGRLDLLHDMEERGMLPRGVLVCERYQTWEEMDMRFGNLLYDVQEKVTSYIRKNYEDKD